MHTEKIFPLGQRLFEPNSPRWAAAWHQNEQIKSWVMWHLAQGNSLAAGSWDGTTLSGIAVDFFNATTGTYSRVQFANLVPGSTAAPTLWVADQTSGTIISEPLINFDEQSATLSQDYLNAALPAPDAGRYPLLITGKFQESPTSQNDFAEFLGILNSRSSGGEPDLIINGGCRVAQYAAYNLDAGCVGRGNRQFGSVDRLGFFTTQTATSGTADQNNSSSLSGGHSARLYNVSIPSELGKLHRVYRIESKDAAALKGGRISLAFESMHNAPTDLVVTVWLRHANASDDFTNVTYITHDGGQTHAYETVVLHKFEAVDLSGFPVQNGLEIEIELDCGITTNLSWEIGAFRLQRRWEATQEFLMPKYLQDLGACLRYYWHYEEDNGQIMGSGWTDTGSQSFIFLSLPSPMRASPMLTGYSPLSTWFVGGPNIGGQTVAGISLPQSSPYTVCLNFTRSISGGVTPQQPAHVYPAGGPAYLNFSAEL
ncbi:MAG: hypothetical protein RRB13_11895 [bacterium]|nr:hypothetical protein [bacterium]